MVKINITYSGELRCKAVHEPSGTELITDAPKDNHGKGESFSPTDLAAASLGTCYLTTMGIYAKMNRFSIDGSTASVEKHMSTDKPRRIVKLVCHIELPAGIPPDKREELEDAAINCPTAKSIHPDIDLELSFKYSLTP